MSTWKDTGNPMFIAILFTIAKTWNQLKCSSINEWIKKKWHIYCMYTERERNTTQPQKRMKFCHSQHDGLGGHYAN